MTKDKPDPDSKPALFDARTATSAEVEAQMRSILRDVRQRRWSDRAKSDTGKIIASYAKES